MLPQRGVSRSGLSITEVLVALFVVAIGMTALLALFPVGAIQMGRAVKDDRAGHLAANAAGKMRALWKYLATSTDLQQMSYAEASSTPNAPLRSPDTGTVDVNRTPTPTAASRPPVTGEGYPVFLDPIGWLGHSGTPQEWWLAGDSNSIPRRPLPFVVLDNGALAPRYDNLIGSGTATALPLTEKIRATYRMVGLLDDLTFPAAAGGVPDLLNSERGRYTWAVMFKSLNAPALSDIAAGGVHWQVVVFDGRRHDNVATPTLGGLNRETTYPATFDIGTTQAIVTCTPANQPRVRRGTWILDSTMGSQTGNGYFYRIVDYDDTQVASTGRLILELQDKPLRSGTTAMFIEGVAEVFTKYSLSLDVLPSYN